MSEISVFEAAAAACREGRSAALATVVSVDGSAPRSAGARMLVHADGTIVGTVGGGALEYRVVEVARRVIGSGRPERIEAHLEKDLGMICGGRVEVYVEPLAIAEQVVVFGAGHIGLAVVPLLRSLGFSVTVVDSRPEYANAARFPGCTVHAADPIAYAGDLAGGPGAWWLVLTHSHTHDRDLVRALIVKPCAWIGMIGSRNKVRTLLESLRAEGIAEAHLARLSAPVGLDIGAETPAEIAVSIAAEMVRVRRKSEALPLPFSHGQS